MVKTEPESKPSCKRSLEFNSHETPVDEYLKTEDRIESVQYPFCSIPRDLASPISKRVLMKAYLEVARSHNANESFEGIFSWKNFLVSEQSEILKLVGVRAVPLTPDGRKADGKKFAMLVRGLFDDGLPEDLKGWLKNMEQGWEDALLLNHIYMRDRRSTLGEFLMMYHCLLGLEGYDSTKYEAFVKSLATYNAWHHNGFKWSVLKENKDYKKSNHESNRHKRTRCEEEEPKKKNKESPSKKTVKGVLKCIRNTWAHPADKDQEYFLAIILGEYPELLPDVQLALYISGFYGQAYSIKQFS